MAWLRPLPLSFILIALLAPTGAQAAAQTAEGEPVDRDTRASLARALEAREYEASESARGLQAPNRAHALRSYFGATGVRVVDRTAEGSPELVALSLTRLGREGTLEAVAPGAVSHEGARVEITRPGLREWYVNSPAGLEQGFTLVRRPKGEGALVLEVAVSHAAVSGSGDRLRLRSGAGRHLALGELVARDAAGEAISARFVVAEPGYRIVVEDGAAVYPVVIDPLLTESFDTEIGSGQASSQFGVSVASAGDVDGDGYADLIVGAQAFDNGETNEGAAFVFLGGPTGIADGMPDAQLESDQAGALFGHRVASAGDVNGDGYADVIVGAPNYDAGDVDEGAAFVFLGSASGIASAAAPAAHARLESDQAGAELGTSVASAGDVNGDGYADVVVGAPLYDLGGVDAGAVLLFLGGASGIAGGGPSAADVALVAGEDSAGLGTSVAGAGDVNGDGYADWIVGQPFAVGGVGAANLFLGTASGVPDLGAAASLVGTESGARFAASVAGAGDVNGDGYADVLVGAPFFSSGALGSGAVFVFLGSASGIVGTGPASAHAELGSIQADARLGASVGTAGDVNGDGYADVVVGATDYDDTQPDEGAAWVLLGSETGLATGDVEALGYAQLVLGQAGAEVGASVASAGDVDGDGYADVVVGARFFDGLVLDEGGAFVYLGGGRGVADGNPLTAHARIVNDQMHDPSAVSVASAGDVNGDGYGDLLVGMAFYDAGTFEEGAVFVFHGSPTGIKDSVPGDADHVLRSDQPNSQFGWAAASAGDVNGDGYGDVIVGARHYDAGESDEGAAFVFLGSPTGIVGSTPADAAQLESNQMDAHLGESVASAGDVNGDGYADVIVGAQDYTAGEPGEGIALVFLGSALGIGGHDPSDAHTVIQSDQAGAALGYSVASAGDVNGDGYADVIVGAISYDAPEANEGAAFVFLGGASGVIGTNPTTAHARLDSNQASSFFGWSVASAGDVNGDGYADVIVGALNYKAQYPGEGAAFVFLGGPAGIVSGGPAVAHARLVGNQAGADLGRRAASAGDVNGDGYADIIVGARLYDAGMTDEGGAWIFLGSAAGIVGRDPATSDAQLESNQSGARLGSRVAPAGDVNGDGFADVVVGANLWDGLVVDGEAAFVFLGGNELGRLVLPRQLRDDGSGLPVQPWGASASADSFRVRLVGTSPRGRERGKLQVEACPPGTPFGNAGCVEQISPTWVDLGTTGAAFEESVSGLATGTLYRWRARILYAPFAVTESGVTPPTNPRGGPWRRVNAQVVEADVRALPETGRLALAAGGLLSVALARRRRRSAAGLRARNDIDGSSGPSASRRDLRAEPRSNGSTR